MSSDRKEQAGPGPDGGPPEGPPGPRRPSPPPPPSPSPSSLGLEAFLSNWTDERPRRGGRPGAGRASRPASGASWDGPEFLFTGVPETLGRGRPDRAPRRQPPDPLSEGPGFLLSGVPEAERRRPREAPADAARPVAGSAPDAHLIDPRLLVAPDPPRPTLRQRLAWFWQALRERLEHTSQGD